MSAPKALLLKALLLVLLVLCPIWLAFSPVLQATLPLGVHYARPREYFTYDDLDNYERLPFIDGPPSMAKLRWILTEGEVLGVYEPASLLAKLLYRTVLGGAIEACAYPETCTAGAGPGRRRRGEGVKGFSGIPSD